MSIENQIADFRHRAAVRAPESTMSPCFFIQMPPEIIRMILKHLRSDNGVIGKADLSLIKTLRTKKGSDGKVHPLYEVVISEVYATSMNPLTLYHFSIIPHQSFKDRFANLVIPIAMPCIIGVPAILCPSPYIHHIRLCAYGLHSETNFKKIVHTWIESLGSVEILELQTRGVHGRMERHGIDGEYDSVILPRASSTFRTKFARYEYDMCTIDAMLGVVGKRSDGYSGLRDYTCVWQVPRGERLKSLGFEDVSER